MLRLWTNGFIPALSQYAFMTYKGTTSSSVKAKSRTQSFNTVHTKAGPSDMIMFRVCSPSKLNLSALSITYHQPLGHLTAHITKHFPAITLYLFVLSSFLATFRTNCKLRYPDRKNIKSPVVEIVNFSPQSSFIRQICAAECSSVQKSYDLSTGK
jgi:hypothetical protein